ENYESKIETITTHNFKITNSYKIEPLNLKISKAWNPENPDQSKLSEIKVDILRDGLIFETVAISAPEWEKEVTLNKNDKFGHEYVYTIKEQHVDGYTSLITGDIENGFEITNTRAENVDIKVAKEFDESSPGDATSVEFNLLQNNNVIETVTLTDPNWSHIFEDMPAFDNDGIAYVYTVEETKVDGTAIEESPYKAVVIGNVADGFTIYNTYEQGYHEEIAIKKVWEGKKADSVTVQLIMSDDHTSIVVKEIELSESNNWEAVVTNLPKTSPKGVVYTYTFKEINVDEDRYEVGETLGNIEEGFTITNTYIPETTDISVKKQWINGPDIDEVEVELLQIMGNDSHRYNDEIITLKATDNFEYIWKDVPKTDIDGNLYSYTVNEVSNDKGVVTIKVDGVDHKFNYTFATSTGNTWFLRNEYIVEETEVEFTKEWIGGPEVKPEIKVQLLRNGLAYKDPITLQNGETTGKWTNLPKTDLKGNPYTYTVDEVDVPKHYEKVVDGFTITNTFDHGDKELTFKKIWNGGPETKPAITVQLFQNGLAFGDPVEFTNGTQDYTWPTKLPIRDANGQDYVYTIDEVNVPENYEKFVEGMTINNTYTSPKKDIQVKKVWSGGLDDKSYLSYSVQLFRKLETDDDFVAASDKILLPGNRLEHTFKNLDVTDAFGNVYEYKVDEIDVPTNYEKSVDGYTITNTYKVPKTEVKATKIWIDGPKDKPTIELQLYRNGEPYSEEPYNVPVELTNGETTFTFSNLDETDENGLKYLYTVEEVNVPENYRKSVDGLEITNTYISPKTEVTVEKNWVGGNVSRPDIYVQLFRNGSPEGSAVKLTDGKTSHTWSGLDVTDKDAVDYTYTVDEVDVPSNYNKEVTGDAATGFVITNTLKTYAIGDYTWIDEPKQNGLQDSKQEVLPGVIVELYDKTGTTLLDETTTDENGKYIFDELVAGEYTIKFTLTKEQAKKYEFTIQNATGIFNKEKVDSDADQNTGWTKVIKLDDDNKYLTKDYEDQPFKATEGIDPTWDAGVILKKVEPEKPAEKTYAIGDYTWIDTNKDGKQDNDEEVLAGVIVELYDETGTIKLAETTTDENGKYIFDELEEGNYKVKFTLTKEQAKIYEFTTQDAGSDDTVDSDADVTSGWTEVIKLNDNNKYLTKDYKDQPFKATEGIDPTWDAGVILKKVEPEKPVDKTYAIGDYVWVDDDYSGAQGKDKIVLPGVTVTLYDFEGNVVGVTTTDENGRYHFDNLPAGDYKVHFELTEEQATVYTFTKKNYVDDEEVDSDSNRKGYTVDIKLDDSNKHLTHDYDYVDIEATEGIDPTWDAGVIRKEAVKMSVTFNKVWSSESKVDEVEFILFADGVEVDRFVLTQALDWEGVFEDLPAFNKDKELIVYTVEEVVPNGFEASYETETNDDDYDVNVKITNTEKPEEPEEPEEPGKPEEPEEPEKPLEPGKPVDPNEPTIEPEKPKESVKGDAVKLPLTGSVAILPMIGTGFISLASFLWSLGKKEDEE
ncbi:MAG TPA: Cna B-type domain-containing protein, partial [Erysipelothrix sp.]|nr:Cna B-type domain-containing protein [Erysipelothrix sp.]